MNGTEEGAQDAQATDLSPQDFLKKHVRGIPREKMKEKKVYYGFKYRDLKDFINSIIGQYKDVQSPDLLSKISELELKAQTLRQQKEGLERELQEKLAAAEAKGGAADEYAKRSQDLSAQLAASKEDFAKLEKEVEFLEGELQKLDASNKDLTGQVEALARERDALQAELDRKQDIFEKEQAALEEKVAGMEQIVAASQDAQKLMEMQKEYETYRDLLKAYEKAAAESVDVEPQPNPEKVESWIASVRGRVAEGSKEAGVLAELEGQYGRFQEASGELIEKMYEGQGSFRTVLELGKLLARNQHVADELRILDTITAG
ncbi:MAG: hypothetical protein ACYS47_09115 [Planctomycetota bacterium]